MNKDLKEAIRKLYDWQYGFRNGNDKTMVLYSLFQNTTAQEFQKIAETFPIEARAYHMWNQAKDPIEFFKKHGVWKDPRGKDP